MPNISRTLMAAALLVCSQFSFAQSYPTKPINIVAGYTPGGSVDLAARIIAPYLSQRLGQPVTVENLGGASGSIGAQKVVNAASDGYTLLLGTSAEISIVNSLSKTIKYNGMNDLTPIAMIGTQPMVLVGNLKLPYKNADELIAGLKANPGKLSYGSAGNGSLPNLSGELFKQLSGTFLVHIPYRGAAPMVTDILGGQIELGMLVLSSALPHLQTGKMIAYGITEPTKAVQLPNVPALSQSTGLKDLNISVFFGIFANAKTPPDIIGKVEKEMTELLKLPEVRTKLIDAGFSVKGFGAQESKRMIQQQQQVYSKIINTAKIIE